jgi:manganese/zinc/iron transport system substrate-binding protein
MSSVRALVTILLAAVASGCGAVADTGIERDVSGRPIRAVATIGMIADAVENIGGKRVDVTALMGPGVDPHLYKASEGDVIRLAETDVVFYNGLHLEAKMADVFERMRGRILTVPVGEAVPRGTRLAPADFSAAYDPHVWFDVRLWMLAGERVRDTLVALDPAHASDYRANARRYLRELAELDRYVRSEAARVPREQRVLITAHDAFKYFGRAYGFEVHGLQGISTATESGAGDIQRLADFIAERRIRAIFVESSVSPRTIEAVQEAVEARGFDVEIGGQLYSDAMGDPGTPEGTYVGMVRHNIDTIVAGLLGHAEG